jgi:hypothetical protein
MSLAALLDTSLTSKQWRRAERPGDHSRSLYAALRASYNKRSPKFALSHIGAALQDRALDCDGVIWDLARRTW